MKEVGPKISIKEGSEFWKSMQEAANLDAEKAATRAAEQARKETLARAAQRTAEKKAYLDSLVNYDELKSDHESLKLAIKECAIQNKKLYEKISENSKSQKTYQDTLQCKCYHSMVIERKTSYRDEYDSWHDGPRERKCVECFLTEQEERHVEKPYDDLNDSRVVLLRRTIDGKEYELEFDDLKWDM